MKTFDERADHTIHSGIGREAVDARRGNTCALALWTDETMGKVEVDGVRVTVKKLQSEAWTRREFRTGVFAQTFFLVLASVAFALIGSVAASAQRVEVLSASYGVDSYRVEVTERVQRLASNGEAFEVSSRNLGLPSVPIPGKELTVVYSVGRRQFRESVPEGET